MQVRYRYRIYPHAAQRQPLARAFGCARVAFNDAVRLRDQAHERCERLSGTAACRVPIEVSLFGERDIDTLTAAFPQ